MTENTKKLLEIVSGNKELSDDELDAVAGGGKCICSFGGGGQYSDGSVCCVCVIGGDGNW